MRKKSNFEKKYPLFSKYFMDPTIQNNMIDNADLFRKYTDYNNLISKFIKELDNHFDMETMKEMIIESIVKLPDEMLISLIKAYLASKEEAKANMEFIKYFNKTSNFGRASLEYIEENGLITTRKYRDIPNLAIDYHYNKIKTGEEEFKGMHLENVYCHLTYPQRSYVTSLIESKAFGYLDEIFKNLNLNLISLIKILMDKNIDKTILNKDAIENIGSLQMMILVCLLIEMDDSLRCVDTLKKILKAGRYELVKQIIINNYLGVISNISYESIAQISDEEVIKLLSKKELVLTKQCA